MIRRSRPSLRIVDDELWGDVERRIASVRSIYVKTNGTGPSPLAAVGKRTSYPLSGLLYCAECGAPLTIYGGTSAHYHRCADFKKRGTCKNGLSLRADVARTKLFGFVREQLTGPKEVDLLRKSVAEVLGDLSRKVRAEVEERRQRLARTEQRIAGLIQFIADGDHSDYVRLTLRDLEAQAKAEKAAIAELQSRGAEAVRLPSPEETIERALLFERLLREEPIAGREELRLLFEDGKVLCRPQPEGFYIAEGKLFPFALFSMRLPKEPMADDPLRGLAKTNRGPETPCSIVGCAGSQLDLTGQRFQGLAEAWIPFETTIPVTADAAHQGN